METRSCLVLLLAVFALVTSSLGLGFNTDLDDGIKALPISDGAPCCELCFCTKSGPQKCQCGDIKDRCDPNCENCLCTRSNPPQCRCADVKPHCGCSASITAASNTLGVEFSNKDIGQEVEAMTIDEEGPCCERCFCKKSRHPRCECGDIKDHCDPTCQNCLCTRSIPPKCRCIDIKPRCGCVAAVNHTLATTLLDIESNKYNKYIGDEVDGGILKIDEEGEPCCERCLCTSTKSNPPKCQCRDIREACHPSCKSCLCTMSNPPRCRCTDTKPYCSNRCTPLNTL